MSDSMQASTSLSRIPDRSLAAFRIGMGFVLLLDLRDKFESLGILIGPGSALEGVGLAPVWYDAIPSRFAWQWMLGMMAIATIGFTVGAWTRGTQVLMILIHIGLNARAWLHSNASTHVETLFLVLTLPLPLNRAWSWDRWRGKARLAVYRPAPGSLVLAQLAFIYCGAALAKLSNSAWRDGSATYLALQSRNGTELGRKLSEVLPASLIRGMTYGSLAVEWGGGLCLAFGAAWIHSPQEARQRFARNLLTWGGCCLIAFHLALSPFLQLNRFCWTMITCLFLTLPLPAAPGFLTCPTATGRVWRNLSIAVCAIFGLSALNQNVLRTYSTQNQSPLGDVWPRILGPIAGCPFVQDLFSQRWDMFRSLPTTRPYIGVRGSFKGASDHPVDLLKGGPMLSLIEPRDAATRYPSLFNDYAPRLSGSSSNRLAKGLASKFMRDDPRLEAVDIFQIDTKIPPLDFRGEIVESPRIQILNHTYRDNRNNLISEP